MQPVIGSYNYRSLVDHLKQGQDWNLSRKSSDFHILQGDRSAKIGQLTRISIQDFIDNNGFFERLPETVEHIVISGTNVVANINLEAILNEHKSSDSDVTLLYKKDYQSKILNREVRLKQEAGSVTEFLYDKDEPENRDVFIDTLIINRELFLQLVREADRRGLIDFIELLDHCLENYQVKAYHVPGYLKLINSIESYYQCSMELLDPLIYKELFKSDRIIYTKSKDNHPTVYGKQSRVKKAFVASGSIVNGKVENSIIFRNVQIGKGTQIENSIILQGATVEENAVIKNAIVDKKCGR